jgi:hypothetical protein
MLLMGSARRGTEGSCLFLSSGRLTMASPGDLLAGLSSEGFYAGEGNEYAKPPLRGKVVLLKGK